MSSRQPPVRRSPELRPLLVVVAVAALVRLATLALYPLIDPTEPRYAEIGRRMVVLGDWVTPWIGDGVPFWGKPPFSFWLTAGLAKKEPAPPKEPTETIKPPDNVLASLRVQALDNALMSQLNISAKMTGVVIVSVEGGGQAEAAGLQRGDVIQEVNHETIKTLDEYQKAAAKIKKDELAVLLVNRQGNSLFVAVNPK